MILGVDPGVGGGLATLELESGAPHSYTKMPETERDLWTWLQARPIHFAMIEKVHSSPQMGVVSAFTFGRGYGMLRAFLIAQEVPFEEVSPQKWQKEMNCLTKGNKSISKSRAQQCWPNIKITHAIADALLIAEYGRRMYQSRYLDV